MDLKSTFIIFSTVFISALLSCQVYSQPLFDYVYKHSPSGNPDREPLLIKNADGSLMGIESDTSGFIIFKIDDYGNMVFNKLIAFPSTSGIVRDFIPLPDSTVIVLVPVYINFSSELAAFKLDLNGNVIWSKIYFNIGSQHRTNSFGHSSFILFNSQKMAIINEFGNVEKTFFFSNQIFEIKGVSDMGNDKLKIFGITPSPGDDLFILDMDTSGIITNNLVYTFTSANHIVTNAGSRPKLIAQAPNGDTYCMVALAPLSAGLYHFNFQNQLIWAKKIFGNTTSATGILHINITDNGCLVDCQKSGIPAVYQFDTLGNLLLVNSPMNIPQLNISSLTSLIPDSGNGWYGVSRADNLHVFHVDSAFNGFCAYQNLNDSILNLPVTNTGFPVSYSLITIVDSAFNCTTQSIPWYRYDACTGQLIDSLTGIMDQIEDFHLTIFPNPARDRVTVSIPENLTKGILSFYSAFGTKVLEEEFFNRKEIELNLQQIVNGIYLVKLQNENTIYTGKFLKHD